MREFVIETPDRFLDPPKDLLLPREEGLSIMTVLSVLEGPFEIAEFRFLDPLRRLFDPDNAIEIRNTTT